MTYEVISTGSKGNAVIINGLILIDCGVPFRALSTNARALKLVLLTHIHGDHFKPRTAAALHRERPALRWGCCEWMVGPLLEAGVDKRMIDVLTPGHCFVYQGLGTVMPERLVHNVPNCGYHIWMGVEALFYATDTGSLDGVAANGYDLYLVEANHTRAELGARLEAKRAAGEYAYEWAAAQNHLSLEQAEDWIYQNIGPNGRYAFLHQHEQEDCRKM
ncbi:MBL fold metallo-hydrolase [Intestinimonas massiliensis]|uniref:MBL fold metallo-hydrolase n=1 Tax=Intestinimonas massiliensis (ex Afouda et al. 2020) TaxID=1673721 RepID=A0AAW5JGC1_9FIRM|nr:MBL fold metallo-hydrolase [Intestinimonas massiliensis (ex Afouda et al. 2020)]MCQ4769018.1 MBL fold metallo-hydrolase [Intestinimonas massiliensis (ex Afouda et al. 2020)]MCQ4769071.1 MBL fold metallo-hydrolase [Intestinimonas massiliensis (ex Afouda et al. 2020)]